MSHHQELTHLTREFSCSFIYFNRGLECMGNIGFIPNLVAEVLKICQHFPISIFFSFFKNLDFMIGSFTITIMQLATVE